MRQNVDHTFTDGWLVVRHPGGEPVKLLSVQPVLEGDGLDYLGGFITAPTAGTVQYIPSSPPRDQSLGPLHPIEGAVLTEDKHQEFLLGFRVTGEGRTTRSSVRVAYEQAGRKYTKEFPATLAVCAPAEGPPCEQQYVDLD